VTIALSMRCGFLSLVGSDSEFSFGYEVTEAGKIIGLSRTSPAETIFVSGAGNSAYVTALAQEITNKFGSWNQTLSDFELWLKTTVEEFYRIHIHPSVGQIPDPPACRLIIAAQHETERKSWSTTDSLLVEHTDCEAVGIGNAAAMTLLNSLYSPFLRLDEACVLAAYVLHRVKRAVEGCGFETEIRFIHLGRPGIVPPEFIARCEELFERHRVIEKELLYTAFNIPLSPLLPELPPEALSIISPELAAAIEHKRRSARTTDDILADLRALREEFARLHVLPSPLIP
jgi:hypothetical protein